jgi:hypothetical protein
LAGAGGDLAWIWMIVWAWAVIGSVDATRLATASQKQLK